ncbi:MAG: ABC-F family ATP-binding cassette domain-containing protein [Nitrospiraceae bacterium]|nr:ABC-F family ATP-binding cassette domain-containing protein [Nitrospira sp.]MCB9776180.1 ABC-F family ATP-binding cassette domain-containing protein [Nitrospiraceae bacterium]
MLHIEQISKSYPTKPLFIEASAHLKPNTRVGLVGPNGSGKTSLMRMILNEEEIESGRIRQRPFLRLGYLPQELESLPGNTILDATHRNQFPDHEAKRILAGLGFQESDWERKIDTLSGGYRMRVALAHLLLSAPDVLMLDEPTNHLDKPTQRWLESFLLSSNFTLLIISHDIGFLDNMVTHIWEVRNHTLQEYRGNYTRFQKLRAERDAQEEAAANRQSKEIARVQNFVDRFRYQANKASQVQSRIKQLEKVKRIELQRDTKRLKFKFPDPPASGKDVFELRNIGKRYGDKIIYDGLDFSVERGQRVALVGENGAGKSTLLKILAGVLEFEKGSRTLGHGVTLHYFAQHQAEILKSEHSILDSLEEAAPMTERNFLRGLAGAFLFSGDDQKKPIKALSGGERNRVALARMLVEPANTLLLDEPTNHLDPTSVDMLTDALLQFPGTMVFISHDPTFLMRVATRVVEIDDGQARDYIGDYEYYCWKRAKELEDQIPPDATPDKKKSKKKEKPHKEKPTTEHLTNGKAKTAVATPEAPSRRDLSKSIARLEKQVATLEKEIGQLEEQIKARDVELADPATYQDYSRWNALHHEREQWGRDLDRLTHKWADLTTQLEKQQSQIS